MVCDCVYGAMQAIRCRCKEYTREAQNAHAQGMFAEADVLFMDAFELAHSLLALPLVDNTSLNVFINSSLNFLRFCQAKESQQRCLQTTIGSLQGLFSSAEYESSVRCAALDSCNYFTQLLADELKSQHNWQEVTKVMHWFEVNWSRYAPELIRLN